jgi:hypothetical protein
MCRPSNVVSYLLHLLVNGFKFRTKKIWIDSKSKRARSCNSKIQVERRYRLKIEFYFRWWIWFCVISWQCEFWDTSTYGRNEWVQQKRLWWNYAVVRLRAWGLVPLNYWPFQRVYRFYQLVEPEWRIKRTRWFIFVKFFFAVHSLC